MCIVFSLPISESIDRFGSVTYFSVTWAALNVDVKVSFSHVELASFGNLISILSSKRNYRTHIHTHKPTETDSTLLSGEWAIKSIRKEKL